MRGSGWAACFAGAILIACASAPPPPPAGPVPEEEHDAGPDDPPSVEPVVSVDAPERSAAPSKGSFEDATATPEALDVHDERVHLTDGQLTGPMRSVFNTCRVSSNAKVTIKTAVQHGRAIGVTVNVRFQRPKSAKPPSRAALKYEAKVSAKIITCVDRAVRALTWPPSSRRDTFTTEL